MLYRSKEIGGSVEPSAMRRDAERTYKGGGQHPDIRLVLTDWPIVAGTTSTELAAKSARIETKTATDYPGVEYVISGIGSSTLVDTDGDVFHKSAIEGMARDAIDLNILLNHEPTLPYSLAGSVLETEIGYVTLGGTEHAVLKLVTDIESKHEGAWRCYEMIAGIDCRPRKLGFSVGCLYIDCRQRTNNKGVYRGLDVFEVLPVEFSIVSMPANRLAWIDNIVGDLTEKGVLPARPGTMSMKQYASSQPVLEPIRDWMDFGPIDGPRLEKIALEFERLYGIKFAMPRSA